MSGYILCYEQKAEKPFYIEEAGIRIWTIEELSYFLCNYIWVLDDHFISEDLCDWIDRELKMPKLARLLYTDYYRGHSLKDFIVTVLNYTGYCNKNEIYQITRYLDGMENVTEMERMKMKGDYFLRDHKYRRAIGKYNEILAMKRNTELPASFYGDVWNNKGVAYASLFLFDETFECMKTAWQEKGDRESMMSFLGALYLKVPEEEFEDRARLEEIPRTAVTEFLSSLRGEIPSHGNISPLKLKRDYVQDNL